VSPTRAARGFEPRLQSRAGAPRGQLTTHYHRRRGGWTARDSGAPGARLGSLGDDGPRPNRLSPEPRTHGTTTWAAAAWLEAEPDGGSNRLRGLAPRTTMSWVGTPGRRLPGWLRGALADATTKAWAGGRGGPYREPRARPRSRWGAPRTGPARPACRVHRRAQRSRTRQSNKGIELTAASGQANRARRWGSTFIYRRLPLLARCSSSLSLDMNEDRTGLAALPPHATEAEPTARDLAHRGHRPDAAPSRSARAPRSHPGARVTTHPRHRSPVVHAARAGASTVRFSRRPDHLRAARGSSRGFAAGNVAGAVVASARRVVAGGCDRRT
jgi:hypothetical protein